jgi:Holliday junction resolvase
LKKPWVLFEDWLAGDWCDVGTGRRSPASGARWHTKEDVRGLKSEHKVADPVMVQAKSGRKTATVMQSDLEQLVAAATKEGRTPYVAIAVGDLAFVGEVVAWR